MGKINKFFEMLKSIRDIENLSEVDESSRIFNKLSDKETISDIELKLMNGDFSTDIKAVVVDKTVNIITTQIKQMKLKNELETICLKAGEYKYPFPPSVVISCGGENYELCSEFVKPKELHYEMGAISADYNLTYSNDLDIIMETYQEIIAKLQCFDWNDICTVSKEFEVIYTSYFEE